MTTVINTPSNGESTGAGFMVGVVVVVIILLGLLFVYGVPAMRNNTATKAVDVNVSLPGGGGTGGGTTGGTQ